MIFLVEVLIFASIAGAIGAVIGRSRGRERDGLVLGFLLGPIGWVLVLMGKDERPRCSECGGVVVEDAKRCKNCGVELAGSDSSTSDEEANQEPARRSRELF